MYKSLLVLLLFMSQLFAGIIKPEDAKDKRDILVVSGNRSSYYTLHKDALVYKVNGPQRVKIYSRAVFNRKSSKSTPFGYEIQLNGDAPLNVNHKQKLSKGVKSPQHPNHYFSKPAVDYITIPAGVNELILRPEKRGEPILVRVLEEQKPSSGSKKRLDPMSEDAPVKLAINGKQFSYHGLNHEKPLVITLEGPTTVEVLSRLGFSSRMGREEDYRIQVRDNGKLVGTYYFSTERSEKSAFPGNDDLVPGKWRTCHVSLDKGIHELKIKLLDTDREVFVKLSEITEK